MRTAVVTGVAGQIGQALTAALHADGWLVVGLDLPAALAAADAAAAADRAESHSERQPDRCHGVDITDDDAVRAAFAAIVSEHGRIDLLINNAGVTAIGAFDDHDVATHARVMAVNHLGAVSCTLAALPALEASRGRIVAISSVTGFAPVVGRPAYVAAKHALTGLFTSLRPELAPRGIGVTLVHPTFLTTGMGEAATRTPGSRRSRSGAEVSAAEVADAVVDAVRTGRDQVLVGRTARAAWHLNRLFPRTYVKTMTRRLAP